jgi:hypothetical protein
VSVTRVHTVAVVATIGVFARGCNWIARIGRLFTLVLIFASITSLISEPVRITVLTLTSKTALVVRTLGVNLVTTTRTILTLVNINAISFLILTVTILTNTLKPTLSVNTLLHQRTNLPSVQLIVRQITLVNIRQNWVVDSVKRFSFSGLFPALTHDSALVTVWTFISTLSSQHVDALVAFTASWQV